MCGADVVLDSFRPGVLARFGLDHERVARDNPRLITCAITGYGQDGPYAAAPGHDLNYVALGGALAFAGPADGPPALPPVQIADIGGGSLWALVGILAALEARHRTGRGAFIDTSMADGVSGFLTAALAPLLNGVTRRAARGADVLTGGQPCYAVYRTADGGFMTLAALEPKFWAAFCAKLGEPTWLKRQYDPTLKDILVERFASQPRAHWEALLAGSDACAEPVLEPEEWPDHPLVTARDLIVTTSDGVRRLRTPTRPRQAPAPGPAPGLGEHTREVLRELGLDEPTIDELIASKVAR
jgi:crotonobetainyl-CoA:carnitine CoA-transferase CaiB-like acyl-CoA transferase